MMNIKKDFGFKITSMPVKFQISLDITEPRPELT